MTPPLIAGQVDCEDLQIASFAPFDVRPKINGRRVRVVHVQAAALDIELL